jgi:hypothetical protein
MVMAIAATLDLIFSEIYMNLLAILLNASTVPGISSRAPGLSLFSSIHVTYFGHRQPPHRILISAGLHTMNLSRAPLLISFVSAILS